MTALAAAIEADNSSAAPTEISKPDTSTKGSTTSARADVLAAFDELSAKDDAGSKSGEAASSGASPSPDNKTAAKPDSAKSSDATRGPDGKFVKAETQVQQSPPDPKATQQPSPLNAPASWKGAGKVDWARLPRAVQEEIAADYKSRADLEARYNPISAVLAPREAALVAQYGGVDRALTQLFALSDYADRDPRGFANWFLAQRGINLQQLVQPSAQAGNGQHAGQQGTDPASLAGISPELMPFVNELNGIKRYLNTQHQASQTAHQQEVQQMQQNAQSEVQAFIADSTKYPYANDVRGEMSMLFQSGHAKTLDEAYSKAVRLNENVWARIEQDRVSAELDRRAKAAAEKERASVSVSGSPGGQPIPAGTGGASRRSTIRDDILAAANEIGYGGSVRL